MKYQVSEDREKESNSIDENLTVPENIISNMRRKDCLDLVYVLAGILSEFSLVC